MVFGIISIILWVATIVGYVIYNLLRKNEQLEQMKIEVVNEISKRTIKSSGACDHSCTRQSSFKEDGVSL